MLPFIFFRIVSALILVLNGTINPGKAFDLTLPLDPVLDGYCAMDERTRPQGAASDVTR